MALTLDATWGGTTSNTYILLAAADTMADNELFDTEEWVAAEDDVRSKALVRATRDIDSYQYVGTRYYYNQLRLFPRVPPETSWGYGPYGGLGTPDANFLSLVEKDEYLRKQKLRVEHATVIQAVYILRNRIRNLDRETQFRGVTSHSESRAGVSESASYGKPALILHPEARDQLRWYRSGPRLVRGSGSGLEYYD